MNSLRNNLNTFIEIYQLVIHPKQLGKSKNILCTKLPFSSVKEGEVKQS